MKMLPENVSLDKEVSIKFLKSSGTAFAKVYALRVFLFNYLTIKYDVNLHFTWNVP